MGFNYHYEPPKSLFQLPVDCGLCTFELLLSNVDTITNLFINKCDGFFGVAIPEITTKEFIEKMLADRDFKLNDDDNGTVFESIVIDLQKKVAKL